MLPINLRQMYQTEVLRNGEWVVYQSGFATADSAGAVGASLVPDYVSEYRVAAQEVATRSEAMERITQLRDELIAVKKAKHVNFAGDHLHWFWSAAGREIADRITRELNMGPFSAVGAPADILKAAESLASKLEGGDA